MQLQSKQLITPKLAIGCTLFVNINSSRVFNLSNYLELFVVLYGTDIIKMPVKFTKDFCFVEVYQISTYTYTKQ